MMSQPALPSAVHEGAVYNAPQMQLLLLQVLAQLQQDRELAKSQNLMAKSQLNIEDRCHKEQLRRLDYEHKMNEQVEACLVRTQSVQETAAEVQRLLEISKKEAAGAVEEARRFKEMSVNLKQELELERNKVSSFQELLVRNVTSGLNNLTSLIAARADNQAVCLKEKQALQGKLEEEMRKFEEEKRKFEEEKRNFEEEKQTLQEKLNDEKGQLQREKQALQEKLEDEKRKCDERDSLATQHVVSVLRQLNDTANANLQMNEYVKRTLLVDIQGIRTSLQSTFSSSFPEQLDHMKNELQAHIFNITKKIDKYIIDPENARLLTSVLNGRTMSEALLTAAQNGNVRELEILLDNGANIETYDDRYKETPLIWAAEKGHLEACRVLLERGANIRARATAWGNRTPLHAAAVNNRLDIIKLLVEKGADLTAKDNDGRTPAEVGNDATKAWFKENSG